MKGFARNRKTGRLLRAFGAVAVLVSLVVALFFTLHADDAVETDFAAAPGSFEEKRGMGRSAGRLYATAMGALTLMAWYRHRPPDPAERR